MCFMNFVLNFFLHTTLAIIVAFIWYSLPGLGVMRLLGLMTAKRILPALLVAPTLGLSTYGSFSLAFTALFGYSKLTLIVSWLLFLAIVMVWINKQAVTINKQAGVTIKNEDFCSISNKYSLLLLIGASLCAVIPVMTIFPTLYQDGLFLNGQIADHAKIAIIDAIAREGLLPINPYYTPDGEKIPLIYYYTWYFLASQLKLLAGATGWQADFALSWFTAWASLGFLSALAIRFTKRVFTGGVVLLLSLTEAPANLLPMIFGIRWYNWVHLPTNVHGLELWWTQAAWVPQHLFSALTVVVLIFLVSRILISQNMQKNYAVMAGLTAAAGFGSSIWVGGVALLFVMPILVVSVICLRLPKINYFTTLKTASIALAVCVLFSIPILISQFSGPSLAHSEFPFGLGLYTSTNLFQKVPVWGYIAHLILFWLQFLPLNLGVIFVWGILALPLYSSKFLEERVFQSLSIGSVFGFLLVVQFIKSTIANNDLGWRAVLVPVMLLMVWSAIGLTELFGQKKCITKEHLNNCATTGYCNNLVMRWQNTFNNHLLMGGGRDTLLILLTVALTIGILSSFYLYRLPDPSYQLPDKQRLAIHKAFLKHSEAWTKVRKYAEPTELVQANPDGYASLTPWPTTLPQMLFADRPIAYANPEYAPIFAFRYDKNKQNEQYKLVQNIFSAQPTGEALQYIYNTLKVKVLLVDKFDAVWNSDAIENSGLYQRVYIEDDYKIYVATERAK